MEHETTVVKAFRDDFENGVLERIEGVQVNGDREHRLPNTSNLAFEGIDSEGALMLLDQHHICCSSGSACTTGSVHASHVLEAMGLSSERARASLRFSFSRFNTPRRRGEGARDSSQGHRQASPDRHRGLTTGQDAAADFGNGNTQRW